MGGLEPVDLRDGPGDDDAHGVGHVVQFQGIGDGLLHHRGVEAQNVGIVDFWPGFLRLLLFWHGYDSFNDLLTLGVSVRPRR